MRNDIQEMTKEQRDLAITKFRWANGGKVTKCPTRVANNTIWLGGRPSYARDEEANEISPEI